MSHRGSGLSLRTTTTWSLRITIGVYPDGTKEWSVSLSRMLRVKVVGPHQKLGRHDTCFLLGLTQASGVLMSPSSFLSKVRLNLKSKCHVLFFPFQTDWSSYPSLRLYWIWVNWMTHTTLQISPSKDSGTSSEARMAWVRISPGPHPILPTAIPLRRYSTFRNSEVFFPLHSERFHEIVARV